MTACRPRAARQRSAFDERVDSHELFGRLRVDGDRAARDELVRRHLPLARKLARRYARTPEPFDDLFQVASLALVKAVDRFDLDLGIAFSSFAVPTILGELKRHFRDKGSSIHLPRGLQELVLKVQAAETKLSEQTQRSPTVVEIADHLSVDVEQVVEALDAIATRRADSLDAPLHGSDTDEPATIHDKLGADDERYALIDTSASLAAGIKRLRAADRRVLQLRVRDELKQSEIADRLGVSQMQVSRILRRVTDELRREINAGPQSGNGPNPPSLDSQAISNSRRNSPNGQAEPV
jgi:RNA polymerase sigma-B factor